MAKQVPFCPCAICEHIAERKPSHIIRESRHVITLKDEKDEYVGMALCAEHRNDWRRVEAGRSARDDAPLYGGVQ